MRLDGLHSSYSSPKLNILTTPEDDLRTAFDLLEYDGFYDYSSSLTPDNPSPYRCSIAFVKANLLKERAEIDKVQAWLKAKSGIGPEGKDYSESSPEDIEYYSQEYNYDVYRPYGTIYGSGGWNRYGLDTDGTIKFSRMHARYSTGRDIANEAADLGFEVF